MSARCKVDDPAVFSCIVVQRWFAYGWSLGCGSVENSSGRSKDEGGWEMAKAIEDVDGWCRVEGSQVLHYFQGKDSRCGRFSRGAGVERVPEGEGGEVCAKCIYGRRG